MSWAVSQYRVRIALFVCLIALLFGLVCWNGNHSLPIETEPTVATDAFVKGVWINYQEYAQMMSGKTQSEYQTVVQKALRDLRSVGVNTVFLHLRSHSDSLYPSQLFPWSDCVNQGEGVSYDPTEYFVDLAHQMGIQVHAWVNPYRILSAGTLKELLPQNPAYEMQHDSNRVVQIDSGVYYNPSSPRIRELVLSGVREILTKYDVDGIQYDDYFYPTTHESFDQVAYRQYCDETDTPLPLAEWRRCQVNLLISGTYQLAKQYGVVFGVSPCADWEKNKESLYADVSAWIQGGYVDYLCPQLYFGFDYPQVAFRFDRLLAEWKEQAGDIPLYVGLASYKVGKTDAGSTEWETSTDLLSRQHCYSVGQGVQGVVIYHYTSLLKQDAQSVAQRERLKQFWLS